MILTDQQILEAVQKREIIIDPFEEDQIQAATYDLRVGKQGATTTIKKIVDIETDGYLSLAPGDFGVVTILEKISNCSPCRG